MIHPANIRVFLSSIKAKVNAYGVPLHFTGTLDGMIANGVTYPNMSAVVDAVSFTYYPQDLAFQVRDPEGVEGDWAALVNHFPVGTQFFAQEVGYQTGVGNNSSQRKQAQFFCNFFKAWDNHQGVIRSANVLRFNDLSRGNAESIANAYGLPTHEAFIQYLQTLGIREWQGTGQNKEAFEVIQGELLKRSW